MGRPRGLAAASRTATGQSAASAAWAADLSRNSRRDFVVMLCLRARELPPVTVVAAQIGVGLGRVRELHGLGVPQQRRRAPVLVEYLPAVADRGAGQRDRFRAARGVLEIAGRRRAALERRDPF